MFLLMGPLLILVAVIPSENVYPDNDELTYADLWRAGDGYLIIAVGVIWTAFAIASFKRLPWGRYIWPMFFVGMFLYALIARPEDILAAVVWFFITRWYFFRKTNVVEYFKGDPINVAEQGAGADR